MQILNMFNTGSGLTGMKLALESADSGLELADYSTDSNTDSAKVGVWVRALKVILLKETILHKAARISLTT